MTPTERQKILCSLLILSSFVLFLGYATGALATRSSGQDMCLMVRDAGGTDRLTLTVSPSRWPSLNVYAASGAQVLGNRK
ncbi:MAG: hypothetical protein KC910_24950 [Candidatus Eremiobacteraeota bacterium]|nr:hypothetical protein [Candidatus Eremiobacteraeota bacterium]